MDRRQQRAEYWRHNLRYLAVLLSIWFLVSFGCGILWVDALNTIRIGGFKLGFWFAQQGSIVVFVLLIVVYVKLMNRLDRRFDVDDRDEDNRDEDNSLTAAHLGAAGSGQPEQSTPEDEA